MSYVKTTLFLASCFLVGMALMMAVMKWRGLYAQRDLVPGVGSAPPLHGFFLPLSDSAETALAPMADVHGSAVALNYPATPSSATAKILSSVVARAHHFGLKTVLLPPPVFSPRNPYPQNLETIASEAQAAKVDVLCLSWLNVDADSTYWNTQAQQVRKRFRGQLILAATAEILPAIDCTQCADFLGVIGPITLPRRLPHAADNVDLHALRVAWDCRLDEFESLALKEERPIMLLNMAIPETIRAKLALPGQPPPTPTPDLALQSLAYEALLYETKGRTDVEGIFIPAALDANAYPDLSRKIARMWPGTPDEKPGAPLLAAVSATASTANDDDSGTDP